MEDNTNDLPEKKYPESAMEPGPVWKEEPDRFKYDPTLMAVYAGPAQMGGGQPMGFVYAGPNYNPSSNIGMMSIFPMTSANQQNNSMLMAYAGPSPTAAPFGIGTTMTAANPSTTSQATNQRKVKFCPKCGFAEAETAHFCTECGASLEEVEVKEI